MYAPVSLLLRRRRGESVSAESVAAECRLSPRQIAAAVEDLSRRGFVIESHPLLGLRLVGVPPALEAEEIACGLAVGRVGRQVRCVGAATSTSDLAWQAASGGPAAADGLAVFAEAQTAGRGRRGNAWVAPPHTSILMSVLLSGVACPGGCLPGHVVRPGREHAQANSRLGMPPGGEAQALALPAILTRGAAAAVAEAIESQCRLRPGIKWPNDIVIEDRKVAGILVESRPVSGGAGPVVIGIGINVAQEAGDFPPDLRPHAASLASLGEPADRTLLARAVLERLDAMIAAMADADGADAIRRRAAARCVTVGRRIALCDGGETFTGEVLDLDPDYGLVLRLDTGGIRRCSAMTSHVLPPGQGVI